MNPEVDEDWYEEKRRRFGGDDGSVTIPIDWVEIAKKRNSHKFRIKLTPKSVSLK